MQNIRNIKWQFAFALVAGIAILSGCEKEEQIYEKTRLFRPVLNEDLTAEGNVIIVNLANIREAESYTIEVSQDEFATVEYSVTVDTNYVLLNSAVLGDDLLYNTLYQVRAMANASNAEFDSKLADLGSVRTQRFPSIQLLPRAYDVTDTKARVRWVPSGAAISGVKIFTKEDVKLKSPLASYPVNSEENEAGEVIIDGLTPSTSYQVAIYSGSTLRGWVDYTTLVAGIDPNGANVVNLSDSDDPDALKNVIDGAADGAVFLLKKGVRYNVPTSELSKSITIVGAYGLIEERASLFTTSDWKIAKGSQIDHVVFQDLIFIGEDPGGDYVFNPSHSGDKTVIKDLKFLNCEVTSLRGILRIRSDCFVNNFTIDNSIVHNLGNYGVFTTDTDGDGKASIDNVSFTNSTFYQMTIFVTSRQNIQSFVIDACTFNDFTQAGQQTFRFRGGDGRNNVVNGLTISNSIFGHGWDVAMSGDKAVAFNREGLKNTSLSITNTWATADFAVVEGTGMAGFPPATYNKDASSLWQLPADGIFNFKDAGFAGKFDSGDPRWRAKL
ncbi:MAG: DUF4957 domain-containing protein [Saprospiraceae bacterium]|nr:DUF4957 domain-containing protein [Saprospiraceae bacterium]